MIRDMIGQPIEVGDFVVHYNNIYQVLDFGLRFKNADGLDRGYIQVLLYDPAPSTRKKMVPSYEVVKLDQEKFEDWCEAK